MFLHKRIQQSLALFTAFAFFLLSAACGNTVHPNQLSPFDGSTYDAFVVAHGALDSLRAQVSTTYPQYKIQFNGAAVTYKTALDSYILFRQDPAKNQAEVAMEINNLTVSIVSLETVLEQALHPTQAQMNEARAKADHIRSRYESNAQANISLSDILTELEIAASVAQAIPGASPYAALAAIIIQATSQAVSALKATSGQPIDLSLIAPVAAI